VIKSFKCRETKKIFNGKATKKFPQDIQHRALRKLEMIEDVPNVTDLRLPPSNHLEPLSGDRKGQWSIRVNDKYRVCFEWKDNFAENVELVDYH
jgi:proteic killer suppression protein